MRIRVNTKRKTNPLGDLYGIFFEDLNHAADGGLYAEMVQNRSFEFAAVDHPSYHGLTAWEKIDPEADVRLVIETGNAVSEKNPHYLGMDILTPGEDTGVCNLGFGEGMYFQTGALYRFTCYAKREQDLGCPLTVSLRNGEGGVLASQEFWVTDSWQKIELELTSPADVSGGRLAVAAAGRGKVYLDFVSLFPKDTYKGRTNGMRRDLAEMLEAMHPKFMRFPGGCLVHDGSLDPDARDALYRWKNTIGPVEQRPARRSNWGYNQTLGLGFYEYFQFCEDIGAKPLPVISAGYDPHHHRAADLTRMQPWIDEALDLIEFANGDSKTRWGAVRAEMGHEEPFGMEYLGIGNEEVGEAFFERFEVIYREVRKKHPEIKIIGTSGPFSAGSEYERGWDSARKNRVDLVDEHYYMAPEWFLANCHRYDSFRAEDPKVFLGEYASWGNTWYNALAESAFLVHLEKNAHAVGMACYAPMLCHKDYVNWQPDMIWFDQETCVGTANYYVQKMFMEHQGNYGLETVLEGMPEPEMRTAHPDRIAGKLQLSCHESKVHYRDISWIDEDTGEVHTFPECTVSEEAPLCLLSEVNAKRYTLRLKAREEAGYKGFRIYFGWQDADNTFCWELGGWQNQDTAINERISGRGSDLSQALLTIERNREYELELRVDGRKITALADGEVYLEIESLPVSVDALYAIASEEDGDIILKAANVSREERRTEIFWEGLDASYLDGSWELVTETMSGWKPEEKNEFADPEKISPKTERFPFGPQWNLMEQTGDGMLIETVFPPESFQIWRIAKKR